MSVDKSMTKGGSTSPVIKREYLLLVPEHPIKLRKRPRLEYSEQFGELNFMHNEILKKAVVHETVHGVEVASPGFLTLFVPWANIRELWYDDKEVK